ncbi:hypothetical protein [Novilysobacter arseniciresistens]|uniref:hypothetical protein n=1 Tax=Novilysobacter arseniciresistens TaxID=1385522 RepID=UPI00136212F9|nr:hypothetical protein [Lysobacter arseniciresistens]
MPATRRLRIARKEKPDPPMADRAACKERFRDFGGNVFAGDRSAASTVSIVLAEFRFVTRVVAPSLLTRFRWKRLFRET